LVIDFAQPQPPMTAPLFFTIDLPTNTWTTIVIGHGPRQTFDFEPRGRPLLPSVPGRLQRRRPCNTWLLRSERPHSCACHRWWTFRSGQDRVVPGTGRHRWCTGDWRLRRWWHRLDQDLQRRDHQFRQPIRSISAARVGRLRYWWRSAIVAPRTRWHERTCSLPSGGQPYRLRKPWAGDHLSPGVWGWRFCRLVFSYATVSSYSRQRWLSRTSPLGSPLGPGRSKTGSGMQQATPQTHAK